MLDNSNRKMYNDTPSTLSQLGTHLFGCNTLNNEEQFRVRAGTILSVNSKTEVVCAQDFSVDYLQLIPHRLKVEICEVQSRLFSSGNLANSSIWIKEITLATDHHCCNVELEAENEGLVLKVKRSVLPGEPLRMWFGERFRAILDIPFLTSCHIEENLTYKCHLCDRIFEGPNPLKLHIALKCDKLSINYLWQTLAIKYSKPSFLMNDILSGNTYQPLNYQISTTSNFTYSDLVPKLLNPLLSSTNLESSMQLRGATSKIVNHKVDDSLRNLMIMSPSVDSCANIMSPMIMMSRELKMKSDALRKQSGQFSAFKMLSECSLRSDYEVEKMEMRYNSEESRLSISDPLILENEASSSGKTTDGNYQCVICHKRYSRKYGLKIHFRTHTGYKPLHCKYCGRAFGDPSNLNKHVRLHMNAENARYKCKYCDKGMVRRRDLERHIQKKHCLD